MLFKGYFKITVLTALLTATAAMCFFSFSQRAQVQKIEKSLDFYSASFMAADADKCLESFSRDLCREMTEKTKLKTENSKIFGDCFGQKNVTLSFEVKNVEFSGRKNAAVSATITVENAKTHEQKHKITKFKMKKEKGKWKLGEILLIF